MKKLIFILPLLFALIVGCSVIDTNDQPQAETYRVSQVSDSLEVRYLAEVDYGQDWFNFNRENTDLRALTTEDTPSTLTFLTNGVADPQIVIVNRNDEPVQITAGIYDSDSVELALVNTTLQPDKAVLVRQGTFNR